jgi:hypothetical protein
MIEKIIITLIAIALFSFVALQGLKGLNKTHKNECKEWQEMAISGDYPDYYIVGWQKEQCDFHGIEIDAPVR